MGQCGPTERLVRNGFWLQVLGVVSYPGRPCPGSGEPLVAVPESTGGLVKNRSADGRRCPPRSRRSAPWHQPPEGGNGGAAWRVACPSRRASRSSGTVPAWPMSTSRFGGAAVRRPPRNSQVSITASTRSSAASNRLVVLVSDGWTPLTRLTGIVPGNRRLSDARFNGWATSH